MAIGIFSLLWLGACEMRKGKKWEEEIDRERWTDELWKLSYLESYCIFRNFGSLRCPTWLRVSDDFKTTIINRALYVVPWRVEVTTPKIRLVSRSGSSTLFLWEPSTKSNPSKDTAKLFQRYTLQNTNIFQEFSHGLNKIDSEEVH